MGREPAGPLRWRSLRGDIHFFGPNPFPGNDLVTVRFFRARIGLAIRMIQRTMGSVKREPQRLSESSDTIGFSGELKSLPRSGVRRHASNLALHFHTTSRSPDNADRSCASDLGRRIKFLYASNSDRAGRVFRRRRLAIGRHAKRL